MSETQLCLRTSRVISKIICAHLYYFKWLHPFPNFNYLLLQNFSRLTKHISNAYLFFPPQIVILYCGAIVICVCLCGQMSAFFEIYFCLKKIQISVALWIHYFLRAINLQKFLPVFLTVTEVFVFNFVFTENNKAKNIYVGFV